MTIPYIYCFVLVFLMDLFLFRMVLNWRFLNKRVFTLCCIYAAGVLCLTLVLRIGMDLPNTVYDVTLARIVDFCVRGNVVSLYHFLLNMLLLLPLGVMIRFCDVGPRNRWWSSLIVGMLLATFIETLQYFCMLGESDIDDIIANTIGCVIGFFLGSFFIKVRKNWKIL